MAIISTLQSGKDTIKMLKDIFNIGIDMPIRSIILRADCENTTTLEVKAYVRTGGNDIIARELIFDEPVSESKYEITVRKINHE